MLGDLDDDHRDGLGGGDLLPGVEHGRARLAAGVVGAVVAVAPEVAAARAVAVQAGVDAAAGVPTYEPFTVAVAPLLRYTSGMPVYKSAIMQRWHAPAWDFGVVEEGRDLSEPAYRDWLHIRIDFDLPQGERQVVHRTVTEMFDELAPLNVQTGAGPLGRGPGLAEYLATMS